MIWEHFGDNRSGKTLLHAIFAWEAYNQDKQVLCNCEFNPVTQQMDHILNFPHIDYEPKKLFYMNLRDCCIITDQAELYMDSALRNATARALYRFGYQVKKRGIDWHFDTVRIKNIEIRVRLNPDFALETKRFPRDYKKPLEAIKIVVTPRYGKDRTIWIRHPETFFPLYNHDVMVVPEPENC